MRMNQESMVFAIIIVIVLSITTFEVVDRVLQYREIELSYQQERDCAQTWQPPTIPNCDDPAWERIINGCEEQD